MSFIPTDVFIHPHVEPILWVPSPSSISALAQIQLSNTSLWMVFVLLYKEIPYRDVFHSHQCFHPSPRKAYSLGALTSLYLCPHSNSIIQYQSTDAFIPS